MFLIICTFSSLCIHLQHQFADQAISLASYYPFIFWKSLFLTWKPVFFFPFYLSISFLIFLSGLSSVSSQFPLTTIFHFTFELIFSLRSTDIFTYLRLTKRKENKIIINNKMKKKH